MERLIVIYVVFEKELIFHEFVFETSDLELGSRNQAFESTQLRVTMVRQGCFFFH